MGRADRAGATFDAGSHKGQLLGIRVRPGAGVS
jgi:hypothetical protein